MTLDKALEKVAIYEFAVGASKNVPGLEQFADFYKRRLSANDKRLLTKWVNIKNQALSDLLAEFEANGANKGASD